VAEPQVDLMGDLPMRRRLVSIEAAAVAGLVAAVGWFLSFRGLLEAPGIDASDAEIVAFYAERSNSTTILLWLQVLMFATVAFLWFIGVIRGRIGDHEPKLFGTVFFGASILFSGLLFLGASLLASPAVLVVIGDRVPAPDVVAMSRAGAAAVLSVFAARVATLVMLSTASLGRATGALPRWLVIVSYLAGLVQFVNVTVTGASIYLVPAWVAVVSIVLLVRHPRSLAVAAPAAPVDS
jgi:hypothetical protein